MHGVILLDKPTGCTSNRILQQVKRLFKAKKAGHTGSLDPLATGVLPICLGREATKHSQNLLDADKQYLVQVKLGITTDTYDIDGMIISEKSVSSEITTEKLETLIANFIGEYYQTPPIYSALKHQGKALYKYARTGNLTESEQIELVQKKARTVYINNIYLVGEFDVTASEFNLKISCSKGTYIRSIVADIGERLGCGAIVKKLRRLAVGDLTVDRACTYEELEQASSLEQYILPVDVLLSGNLC